MAAALSAGAPTCQSPPPARQHAAASRGCEAAAAPCAAQVVSGLLPSGATRYFFLDVPDGSADVTLLAELAFPSAGPPADGAVPLLLLGRAASDSDGSSGGAASFAAGPDGSCQGYPGCFWCVRARAPRA